MKLQKGKKLEKYNVVQHINSLRNILSYASNIGFFFGAGTSCAFGLPNIGQLTNIVKNSLDKKQEKQFDSIVIALGDLSTKNNITVEDVLNYVREIRILTNDREDYEFKGLNGKQAKELDKAICRCIFNAIKCDTEKVDVADLRRFFAWFDSANRSFAKEIYTTNYDMLLEMAMEANRTPYFDGFAGAYEPFFLPDSLDLFPVESDSTGKWIRLWKLHGSLNWMKKPATTLATEHIIRVSRINDIPNNELMIYPSREKYNLSRREPYIAYFDRLKKYLNRGELVFFICGYSFGDEHINEIIFNALRNNNRLYVVVLCFGNEQVDSMSTYATPFLNLCIMGPTKVIANGNLKEWVYVASADEDLKPDLYWNGVERKLILGDFKRLIDFIIENSGRKNIIEEIVDAK